MPQLNATTFERLIDFVSIDLTPFGDEVRRYVNTSTFEAGSPELSHVTWQSHTWQAVPFQYGGFARGGENLVRPAIQLADFTGEFYVALRDMGFAPGATVTRYRALAEDVEADDPNAAFLQEQYVLYNVNREQLALHLELATHLDFATTKIPGFKMMREDYPGLNSAILRG